ncbi:acetyltransferase [Salinimicrobium sp. TIG7-5_MAKvit]|uniref:acetyltransferase n=1 Tax=Salinimicrobium sp. TIG7-5_MAKvit TaxID=3121289 RepID=UPI003C6E0374
MLYRETILVGYSGHGLVVGEAAKLQGIDLKFYVNKTKVVFNPYNLKYLGFEASENFEFWDKEFNCILGIGDNTIRRQAAELFLAKDKEILNICHPKAAISGYFEQGSGNYIAANVTVNPFARIGDYCILNTGSIIEHDCVIGNSIHIAPGAVLAGGVKIGNNSFVGANAVIKEGIEVGENVIIGAGAVVIRDVANNAKIIGNPGREL